MRAFTIDPDGPFSLAAAASFGFGPRTAEAASEIPTMRLAFVRDDLAGHAGVVIRERRDGVLDVAVSGDGDVAAVERQVRRVLSLDHPGREWEEVGRRDPVIGRLQATHPGLRPVLFHSPYEAAAWAILAQRRQRAQAAALRRRLSEDLGVTFDLAGERVPAFPLPARLLELDTLEGLNQARIPQLHAVADAALTARLDPATLIAMDPDEALAALRTIPGIGPFYAALILVRAAGVADVLTLGEPRLPRYVAHFYAMPGPPDDAALTAIAERWRPFRTWATVLIRAAGERAGLGRG